jgi:D-2-hydroxyacid dehydrogenase (NADP+)
MNMLTIVITYPLEEVYLQQVKSVDPNIIIVDASPFFDSKSYEKPVLKNKLDALLAEADVICGYWPPKDVISRSPHVKWIHSLLAGVDRPEWADVMHSPVLITNSKGIHGKQVSELVFTLMLMLVKQAPFCFKMKQEKKWAPFFPQLLHEKTLGIVGLGNIGKEIARLAKSFGMRVIANDTYVKRVTRSRNVDMLMPGDHLLELLSSSDFVVLSLPLTAETRNLIGERELRSMKATSYLINIARGSIVDEDTLIRALEEHWIAGAGLDTVSVEPLAPQSKLWELPNVIITPHIGGRREDYNKLAIPLFCENLSRYIAGKKLLNIVDKKKGF